MIFIKTMNINYDQKRVEVNYSEELESDGIDLHPGKIKDRITLRNDEFDIFIKDMDNSKKLDDTLKEKIKDYKVKNHGNNRK